MSQRFRGKGDRRASFEILNDVAKAAASGNNAAVRDLIDEVLDSSIFGTLAEPLRDRLTRAEIAFRSRTGGGITEHEAEAMFNAGFGALVVPTFCRTTLAQVRLWREFEHRLVPALVALPGNNRRDAAMSPAEAAHVTLSLAQQKFLNPDHQDGPEAWVTRVEERKPHPPPRPDVVPPPTFTTYVSYGPAWYEGIQQWLREEVKHPGSTVATAVSTALDAIGMVR